MYFKGDQKHIVFIGMILLAFCIKPVLAAMPLPTPKPILKVSTILPQPRPKELISKKTTKPLSRQSTTSKKIKSARNYDQLQDTERLTEEDATRYSRIFAFQDIGNIKKARKEIKQLTDHRLMGHVLYQRYMSKFYKTSYDELVKWMEAYADYPGAQDIFNLALKKRPKKGAKRLPSPKRYRGMSGYHNQDIGQLARPYLSERKHTNKENKIIKEIKRSLSKDPEKSYKILNDAHAKGHFNNKAYDALQALVAGSFFYNGQANKAYRLSIASSDRSKKDVPWAGWIAGLSSWKRGKYGQAAQHFERTANSKRASAWMRSAGAHWAARAHLRNRRPQKVSYWLHRASDYPRSFYGIISMKALGMEQARFNWKIPDLNEKHIKALVEFPAGRRALALMDARYPALVEKELRRLNPGRNKILQEAMMALAYKANIPAFQMRLGNGLKDRHGHLYDSALYPDAPWQPAGGYQVDKALVHAFIRQESKFYAGAHNKSSGARGLMQLMPTTARLVARRNKIRFSRDQLKEPSMNILLGQKYLASLLTNPNVRNNIFKLAVAYNAGPGKLARWEKELDYQEDPLLFVESIPVSETRVFLERVLTNYWIYRLKYKQSTVSLEKVASGKWPMYVARDLFFSDEFINKTVADN